MASWAIVIGIDQYRLERISLDGAVHDALEMLDWLTDPNLGGVPRENVALLLSPRPGRRRPRDAKPATKDNIILAIADLMQRSGRTGERLYFYYAGHGLTARVSFSDEPTLIAADFDTVLTDKSISLRSLWDFFETTQFADQFFFVDACRDPWKGELVIGQWTLPQERVPGQDQVQQFILYATSPGLKALQVGEQGAFTGSLVRGLRGQGSAKAWSPEGDYKVRWENLTGYVRREFEARLLPAGDGFQIPQTTGKTGVLGRDPNPVLAAFPSRSFRAVPLRVFLDPETVRKTAEVAVIDPEIGRVLEQRARPRTLPLSFRLPPRTYTLRAVAKDHEEAFARLLDLYEPREERLELKALAAEGAPAEPPAPPDGRGRRRDGVRLTVRTDDPLAPVEIADSTGAVVEVGQGSVQGRQLDPGLYRARVRTPEGEVEERSIRVGPGESDEVVLDAPPPADSPTVDRLVREGTLAERPDRSLEASEAVGPIAAPQLSTILSLAAGFRLHGTKAPRLRSLGMRPLPPAVLRAPSGISVLVGVDATRPDVCRRTLEGIQLRIWPFGRNVPRARRAPRPFRGEAGVGELAVPTQPGPYWLAVERAGHEPMVFALTCLPGCLTMLVLDGDREGLMRVFQYLPALRRDESTDPKTIRRLELLQRIYLGGRLDLGHESAVEIVRAKRFDPLAGCLGGYLLLRLGDLDTLGRVARAMVRQYPALSDGHVLRAEHAAAAGRGREAERETLAAIEVGIPIFTEGQSLLLDGLQEHRIDRPYGLLLSKLFDRRVKTSLWSVWTPDELVAGRQLVPGP